jgi:hypothetical protein
MKPKVYHCLLLLVIAFAAGCRKEEEKPPASAVPAISFRSLTKFTAIPLRFGSFNAVGDSILLTIAYEDGDSDLGLDLEDLMALESKYPYSAATKKYFHNFYLDLDKKSNGVFKPVVFPFPDFSFWSFFRRIPNGNKNDVFSVFHIRTQSPWRGEITYRLRLDLSSNPDARSGRVIRSGAGYR